MTCGRARESARQEHPYICLQVSYVISTSTHGGATDIDDQCCFFLGPRVRQPSQKASSSHGVGWTGSECPYRQLGCLLQGKDRSIIAGDKDRTLQL